MMETDKQINNEINDVRNGKMKNKNEKQKKLKKEKIK